MIGGGTLLTGVDGVRKFAHIVRSLGTLTQHLARFLVPYFSVAPVDNLLNPGNLPSSS